MMILNKLIIECRKFGIKEVVYHFLYIIGWMSWNKVYMARLNYYRTLEPKNYKKELQEWYIRQGGTDNIDSPKTFNRKIQWLKLYDSTPIKTKLADKYLVRDWIKKKIGEQYLIKLLGVYNNYEEIDFEILPQSFVIKANHGSNMNIIVKDKNKLNLKHVKRETDRWMNTVYGYGGMEIHYFNIPPKIIVEEYIEEIDGGLYDYKFHCFHGKPEYIQVIGERDFAKHTAYEAFYDLDWRQTDFSYTYPRFQKTIDKPSKLKEMISIAKALAENFLYVRVDLYLIGENIKFGEMTFTPDEGMGNWNPPDTDIKMGKFIVLDNPEQNNDINKTLA